jgi:hypothetical protein
MRFEAGLRADAVGYAAVSLVTRVLPGVLDGGVPQYPPLPPSGMSP